MEKYGVEVEVENKEEMEIYLSLENVRENGKLLDVVVPQVVDLVKVFLLGLVDAVHGINSVMDLGKTGVTSIVEVIHNIDYVEK